MEHLHKLKLQAKEAKLREGQEKRGNDEMQKGRPMRTVVVNTHGGREQTVLEADGSEATDRPKGVRLQKRDISQRRSRLRRTRKRLEH
jgi:hypothetical protein